jgi:hypothetical protein
MDATSCSGCSTSISGSDVLYTGDGNAVCATCYEKADIAGNLARSRSGGNRLSYVGLGAAVVPFFFHATWSSSVTVDGVVTASSSRDYVALVCGVVALACGALGAVGGVRAKAKSAIGLGALALLLGGFQLARGLGVL